jgi:protein disulfide-isomerase A1
VRGFPSLKWFRRSEPSDYTGGRTEKKIVDWVKKKTGAPSIALGDSRDLVEEFVESHEVAVVAFLGHEHADERRAFDTASYHAQNGGDDSIPFAVAPAKLAAAFGVDAEGDAPPAAPTVVLFKKFDEGKVRYVGRGGDPRKGWDSDTLRAFAKAHSLPLVIPFTEEMAPRIFGGESQTHFLAFCDADAEPELVQTLSEAARAYRGDMLFVTIGKESARIRDFFDVREEDFPTARLVVMGEETLRKYRFGSAAGDGETAGATASLTSLADVSSFIQRFKAGELSPDLKSEDPPEPNDGPVTMVVGRTFDEFVLDPDRDVLVQFYAPWCGHCKRLAPVWEELGVTLTDVESVRIAKMDATANEHQQVDVSGFPTIMLWPATVGGASGAGVEYEGAREMAGFMEFLQEHATIPFTAPERSSDEL